MSIYVYKNNQQTGPFEESKILESLAAGQLSPDDLAIKQGERNWKPLGVLFPNVSNNPHIPSSKFANANASSQIANNPGQKKSGSSKALLFILLGLGGLLIAGAAGIAAIFLLNKPSQTAEQINLSSKNLNADSSISNTNLSNANSRVSNYKETAADDKPAVNTASTNSETAQDIKEKPITEKKKGIVSTDDKPDFTVQAEELVKAKKEAKSPIIPPEKYKGKIIEVTGRVSTLYPEKVKSLPPRVLLTGGRPILEDVACDFDEENKAEINTLKKDQMVTLKGLVPNMWIMMPSLTHCIIVEAK